VSHIHLLAGAGQVAQDVAPVAVVNQRAGRDGDDEVGGTAAVTVIAAAGATGGGAPVLAVDDLRQAVGAGHGADEDRPAVAPVAAVGPSLGHVLFTPET